MSLLRFFSSKGCWYFRIVVAFGTSLSKQVMRMNLRITDLKKMRTPPVCRLRKGLIYDGRTTIFPIKIFRRFLQPRTATKTRRIAHPRAHHKRQQEHPIAKRDKPPPVGGPALCGNLDVVVRAVDTTQLRVVGCFLFAFRHSVGCRSPPFLGF